MLAVLRVWCEGVQQSRNLKCRIAPHLRCRAFLGLPWTCSALAVGTAPHGYLPLVATLKGQSTLHGVRPRLTPSPGCTHGRRGCPAVGTREKSHGQKRAVKVFRRKCISYLHIYFSSHLLSSPFSSLGFLVVYQVMVHRADSSTPLDHVMCLLYDREKDSALFSLFTSPRTQAVPEIPDIVSLFQHFQVVDSISLVID